MSAAPQLELFVSPDAQKQDQCGSLSVTIGWTGSYADFRKRLCVELTGTRSGEYTEWMKEVGYRPNDKDMGFSRWCELTGTDRLS
jgi:hypothetical protein